MDFSPAWLIVGVLALYAIVIGSWALFVMICRHAIEIEKERAKAIQPKEVKE